MGGDLITYAHSQLRVMLNLAALAQMTQNNTEQNVKENRAQNNTAKKTTWVPKYIYLEQPTQHPKPDGDYVYIGTKYNEDT